MKLMLTSLLLLALFACQKGDAKFSKENLELHIKSLSDDKMQGRAPATEGEKMAIDYITEQYKEIGLKPVGGSYTQEMSLVKYGKDIAKSSMSIKNGRKNFPINADTETGSNITFWSSTLNPSDDVKDAEIVFVGYGVEAPEFGWDDFKGVDVKGKILLMLNNDPQVTKENGELDEAYFKGLTRTYYGRWTYKFEQAKKHGAAGAIIVHTMQSAGYGYHILGDAGIHDSYTIDAEGAGFQLPFMAHADSLLSNEMAKVVGKTLEEFFAMAKTKEFKPVPLGLKLNSHIETKTEKTKTYNVMAKLEGTDPVLKDQHIVFSAHYDHKGVAAHEEGKDGVFNGAWDNASGTASIIEMARALSKNPAKRSFIFLACAAEESGSLGSKFFTQSPPLPLKQLVANINIDMPTVFGLTSDMAIVGVNSNSLGNDLKHFALKNPLPDGSAIAVTDDPNPNAGLFYRSDQVNFAKKGIPALFVMSGSHFIGKPESLADEMSKKMYHTVEDEWHEGWDLTGLVRDLKVIYQVAQKVGNDKAQPSWHKGNEFEAKYNALYK
jgi:Zn-dependent M28 family amino/carboxypeptidase